MSKDLIKDIGFGECRFFETATELQYQELEDSNEMMNEAARECDDSEELNVYNRCCGSGYSRCSPWELGIEEC